MYGTALSVTVNLKSCSKNAGKS